ncbi:MAG: caspase family protein, partial [Pseudomonadota bacterium]
MRARTIRNPSGGASVSRAGLAGLAMLAASCWASAGLAQERVALVIGNGAYAHAGDLRNPPNDARLMARTLEALGFAVERVFDADRSTLYRALATFSAKAPEAEVALVFYAGHGIETEGRNYLIPVDAKLETVESTRFEAAPLEDVSAAAAVARTLSLVILDACRDSPFARRFRSLRGLRSTARGLRSIEPAGRNALVAYAAKHGTAALDGEGQANSPFTTALADALRAPPKDVRLLFGGVRDAVLAATGGAQEPFLYGSLGGREILLAPRGRAGETAPAEPRTPSGTSRSEPPPAPFDPGEAIPEDPPIEASAMQGVLGRSRADATPREDAPYEEPTSGFAGAREDGPLRDEVAAEGGDEWPREDLPFEEPPSESAGVREDGPPRDEVVADGGDAWPRADRRVDGPPTGAPGERGGARPSGPG